VTWRTGWQLLEHERSKLRQREEEFIAWLAVWCTRIRGRKPSCIATVIASQSIISGAYSLTQ
jgi:K+ transporter